MVNIVATAPAEGQPVWLVQLDLVVADAGQPVAGEDDVEPMVELLYRTQGVRSAAIVPLQAGLAVAVGLSAPDATEALHRARALAKLAARYVGLGKVAVRRARVAVAPDAGAV
jgi:hypothetical protein